MMRKRPWNRTNHPVYSLSTIGNDNHNMNICSYVTAISMQPKRFIVGVYDNTQTLINLQQHPVFVLQILQTSQYNLVNLLGKQTGKKVDKIRRLTKRNEVEDWDGLKILKNAIAVIKMRIIDQMNGGDHTAFLCEVLTHKNLNEGAALTLDILRDKKIILA